MKSTLKIWYCYILLVLFSIWDSNIASIPKFCCSNHLQSSTILEGITSAVFLTWHQEADWATKLLSYSWIPLDGILLYKLYSLHSTYMMFLNELPTLAHTSTFLLNPWHTWLHSLSLSAGINMHKLWLMISLATENIWVLSLLVRLFFLQSRQQFSHRFAKKLEA